MHTTNYFNTIIEIAPDSDATESQIPPERGGKKTVAKLQYEMLIERPYELTSDDVIFGVYALRKNIPAEELEAAREVFFSKGQPCFRASPLTQTYGWGIHSNAEGKIALVPVESDAYQALLEDERVTKKKAMRSRRK